MEVVTRLQHLEQPGAAPDKAFLRHPFLEPDLCVGVVRYVEYKPPLPVGPPVCGENEEGEELADGDDVGTPPKMDRKGSIISGALIAP